jgi:mannose-6-phosphate isomerase-like protein (cupin superfamily)
MMRAQYLCHPDANNGENNMSRIDHPPGPSVSVADMEVRTARCNELKGSDLCFMDQRIPGHEREMINLLGLGVPENEDDPDLAPKVGPAHGFANGFAKCEPGRGAALHWHETDEVFMPLDGKWSIYWRDGDEEREVILEAGDTVSVPVGIYRGFKNVGDTPATLHFIGGGPDTGKVHWHPSVIDAARETGLAVDDNGLLVEIAAE